MPTSPNNMVLISSHRKALLGVLRRLLRAAGLRAIGAGSTLEDLGAELRPCAFVVDAVDCAAEALAFCEEIRAGDSGDASVLLIVDSGDTETLEEALALGISDFAEEPLTPEVLALRARALALASHERTGFEERRAHHSSSRDDLTGLASRPSFLEAMSGVIEHAREREELAALLYLDIDRFKGVNDALGHAVGDALLQHVARILENQVRATDLVTSGGALQAADISRIGGDEFTVLLSEVGRPEDAGEVAERILAAMQAPVTAHGYQVVTTASIGIAMFPEDGDDVESLLRCADMAMYAAKGVGRGRALFYRPSMGEEHDRRLEVEQLLRNALERDEFEVRYQPRIDLANDVVSGVEALVRWSSPELGEVLPKEFIPIAEESGLIVPIGEWVLETACRQLAAWKSDGISGLRLSVNVSSKQFTSSDVLRRVTDILRDTDVAPHALELEVTERLMLGGDEHTALALRDLRGIGVTLALDDFGTGYSSLSSITRYPLDVLKIDRSIAADVEGNPAAASIVAAVVTLGTSLGLGIVAEGVDSLGQARLLSQLGCDELQGFLVAPALSADAFVRLHHDWRGVEQCKDYGSPPATEEDD